MPKDVRIIPAQGSIDFSLSQGFITSLIQLTDSGTLSIASTGPIQIGASNTVAIQIVSNNFVGINTTIPSQNLHVQGNLRLTGGLYDITNSPGSANQLLISTGSGIAWTSVNVTGILTASGGIPNRVSKFLDEDTLGNSNITDSGTQIVLGSASSISGILTSFGYFGPGTNITNLNASNLASGTVPSAVVSGSYRGITSVGTLAQLITTGFATASGFFGPGTFVTNLNASNLASGTVPSAVVSGSYSGITSVGSLSQLIVTGFSTINSIRINGALYDGSFSPGTANQVLISTGSGIAWTTSTATGILTGTGTINTVPKFNTANSLTNSNITDNGIAVTVNSRLNVVGVGSFTNDLIVNQITVGLGSQQLTTNVAIGFQAFQTASPSAGANVAVGDRAMQTTSGAFFGNVAVGQLALAVNQGNRNIAIGSQALTANTSGGSNIAIGYQALLSATADNGNIAIGNRVMWLLTGGGGGDNVAIGGGGNLTTAGAMTILGASAANNYTTQGTQVAIGAYSLNGVSTFVTTGNQNTAVGYAVMTGITGGSSNVGLGHFALNALTSGNSNTALGYFAAVSNTTGGFNVAVGREALRYYVTVSNQVAVGYQALQGSATTSLNTGTQNTAVGYQAGIANTSGSNNVFVGYQAGLANTSGSSNVFVGNIAGSKNTAGINNTGVGAGALRDNTSGNANTALGSAALVANTTGSFNNAVGVFALVSNTTGSTNQAFGYLALQNNISGGGNLGFGHASLQNNTTSNTNTAFGNQTLTRITTNGNNTAIGADAMRYTTVSNQVAIGYQALTGSATTELNTGTQNTALGYQAGTANTSGSRNTFIGYQVGLANTSGSDNTAVGDEVLKANTTGTFNNGFGAFTLVVNTSGQNNNGFGYQSLFANTTGSANVAFGHVSMQANTTGSDNVAIGALALVSNITGSQNVAIGRQSLRYYDQSNQTAIGYQALQGNATLALNTGTSNVALGSFAGAANTSGSNNTFVGTSAGANNNTGNNNSFFGLQAGTANTSGNSNTFIGHTAGSANNAGNSNTAVGLSALSSNTFGSSNVAIGVSALNYVNTSNNVAIGLNALQGNTTVSLNSGDSNTAVGRSAGAANTSGTNNVFIGRSSGLANTSGSNNVFVGRNSGSSITIGNSNTLIGDSVSAAEGSSYQIALGQSAAPTGSNLGAWGGNTNSTRTDLGVGTFTPLGRIHIETLASGNMGLYIAGAASQTGDLIEINATTNGQNYFTITGIGSVGIYTSVPTQALDINGGTRLRGRLFDVNNAAGIAGQLLSSTGSGVAWTTTSAAGILTGSGTINTVPKFNTVNSLTNSNITDSGTQIVLGSASSISGIVTSFGYFGPGTNITNLNASNLTSGIVPSLVVTGSYSGITSVGNLTNLNVIGIASATGFSGDGANLTNLNASNLASGTVNSARISGSYSGITSVGSLSQLIVTGFSTINNIRISGSLYDSTFSPGSANQLLISTGSGIAWTSVNVTGILTASGGIPNRVSKFLDEDTLGNSNITDSGTQIVLGSASSISGILTSFGYFGPGTNITNLNASNLASGTVPSAVVSGSYSGITSVGTLTQLITTGFATASGFFGPGTFVTNLNASNLASGTVPSAVVSGAYSGITSVGSLSQLIVTGFSTINNIRINGALYDSNFGPGITNQILISTNTGIAWTTSSLIGIVTGTGSPNQVTYWSANNQITGTPTFVFRNGNLGIGTTSPNNLLHVAGTSRIDVSLIINATTTDTFTQRIFAGATTSTTSTSFITLASIPIPTGYTLNIEAKINGWASNALNESGKVFGIFYNESGSAIQVGSTDVVSKYMGVGGNFDIQTSGSNAIIVVKSNSGITSWNWSTHYDYLLSGNSTGAGPTPPVPPVPPSPTPP